MYDSPGPWLVHEHQDDIRTHRPTSNKPPSMNTMCEQLKATQLWPPYSSHQLLRTPPAGFDFNHDDLSAIGGFNEQIQLETTMSNITSKNSMTTTTKPPCRNALTSTTDFFRIIRSSNEQE